LDIKEGKEKIGDFIFTVMRQVYDQKELSQNIQRIQNKNPGKTTALTLVQFINKFDFNRPINNLLGFDYLINTTG
jgi:hypothetical protein